MKTFKKVLSLGAFAALVMGTTVLTSCKDDDPKMEELIKTLILTNDKQKVSSNFKVPAYISDGSKNFKLEWTSNNTDLLKFEYTKDDPDTKEDESLEDVTAVVTQPLGDGAESLTEVTFYAVAKNGSDSATSDEFRVRVEKGVTAEEKFRQFYDTCSSKNTMEISGYVQIKAGTSEYNGKTQCCLYLQEENGYGGYYAYNCYVDLETYNAIEIGDYVTITGQTSSLYNGIAEACYGDVVVDSTKKNPEVANKSVDISADVESGADLMYKQSQIVDLKGAKVVSVTTNECTTTKGKYLSSMQTIATVKLGDTEMTVVLMEGTTPFADAATKTIFDTVKGSLQAGYTINVHGVLIGKTSIGLLNASGVTVTDSTATILPDAEKAQAEIDDLNFVETTDMTGYISLNANGTTYTDVALTYALDGTPTTAKIVDGKLYIIAGAADETIKLTATATVGTETKTKEFTIVVKARSIVTDNATLKDTTTAVYFTGVVGEITNTTYGNNIFVDGTVIYGMYGISKEKYEALTVKPVAGQTVVLYGTYSTQYSNMTSCVVVSIDGTQVVAFPGDTTTGGETTPGGDTAETSTVTASYSGATTNMTEGNNAATIGLDETLFTVTSTAQESTYQPNGLYAGLNKAGEIRMYAGGESKEATKLTFEIASGYVINSIEITFTSGADIISVTVADAAVTGTDGVYTINNSKFILDNTGTSQIKIKTIKINYSVAE